MSQPKTTKSKDPRMRVTTFNTFASIAATAIADACNPLQATCADAIPGFTQQYSVDFTKESQVPYNDWILADYATVNFSPTHGANFTFAKRYDAPYIWSRNYLLFGRVDVEVQAAPGIGLVTGSVLMSDAKDEFDWEFSGNNFGKNEGWVQTNWFGKGITGSYNRGTQERVDSPQTQFHTYTFDWTKDGCKWLIDGKQVHSITNNGDTSGEMQFPQTPARLHLGIWNAGDPDTAASTRQWAAGSTDSYMDLTKVPYSGYVRSVKITPYNPCSSWQYPENFSGKWQDVKCSNKTTPVPATTTSTAPPRSTASSYTVKAGDDGWKIASALGCSIDELKSVNPGINWDLLLVGQVLHNPGGQNLSSSSAFSRSTYITSSAAASSQSSSSGPSLGVANISLATSPTVTSTTTTTLTSTSTGAIVTSTISRNANGEPVCSTVIVTVTAPCSQGTIPVDATGISTNSKTSTTTTTSTSSMGMVQPVTSVVVLSTSSTHNGPPITLTQPTTSQSISSPSVVTVVETRTTIATITLTTISSVCGTVSNGTPAGTQCTQTTVTVVTTTPVTTVIPQTAPTTTITSTTSVQTTSPQALTPFLTTITIPCTSCAGGITTVTSTCSTITSITTVTVGCSSCPNGAKTLISTTTIFLTETSSSTAVNPVTTSVPSVALTSVTTSTTSSSSTLVLSSTSSSNSLQTTASSIHSSSSIPPSSAATSNASQSITNSSTLLSSSSSSRTSATSTASSKQSLTTYTSTSAQTTQIAPTTTSTTASTTPTSSSSTPSASTVTPPSDLASAGTTTVSTLTLTSSVTSSTSTQSSTSVLTTTTLTTPKSTTKTSTTTSSSLPPPKVCVQDKCLNNMLRDDRIEDAHDYAPSFCKDRSKPTPTWLTDCKDRVAATSAFQCVTASATPVPSEDKNGKKCFKFGDQKIWSNKSNQDSDTSRKVSNAWAAWNKREEHEEGKAGFFGRFGRFNKDRTG